MPDTPVQLAFDYGSLDTDTAQFVLTRTNEIKGLFKQTVQNIIAIGLRLIQVKECLAHGQWQNWLETEFDWTDRTALNFMNVARQFQHENFSDLNIAASALYLLAFPSTPAEAREEAIARAQAGERITVSTARELRDRYISPQPQADSDQKQAPAQQPPAARIDTSEQSLSAPAAIPSSSASTAQPAGLVSTPTPTAPPAAPASPPPAATTSPPKRKRAKEEKALSVTPRQVQPGEWWKLGKESYLYCGDPASAEFQKLLPKVISLSIAFPPTLHWQLDFLSSTVISSFALHTAYEEDQDLRLLREAMQRFLEVYTDGGDSVVLSFLPDSAILNLVDELDCRFLCADPDPKRCDAALTVWSTTGRTAERVKAPQGKKRLATPALSR